MYRHIRNLPIKNIAIFSAIILFLLGNANAKTQVINAEVVNIEPIYMKHTVERIAAPCGSLSPRMQRSCWNFIYKKKKSKLLKGYRIRLSYNGNKFTTRMSSKPNSKKLKIRVMSDLLNQQRAVAINAAVVY